MIIIKIDYPSIKTLLVQKDRIALNEMYILWKDTTSHSASYVVNQLYYMLNKHHFILQIEKILVTRCK